MQTEQYEINWKNYYDTLELNPNASAQEIKQAYRFLAHMCHPDRVADPLVSDRMAAINEAYEVLSDTDRRIRYDEMFTYTCCRQQAVAEEARETEISQAILDRLARERARNRWKGSPLVFIPATILERLLEPIPTYIVFFAWITYLSIFATLIWSLLP